MPPGPDSSFVTDKVNVFYTESVQCEVINEKLVPIEFTRVTTSVDKTAAKQAMKNGDDVPGCQLKINYNLQIKHAGPRSQANRTARTKKRAEKTVDQANSLGEA